MLKPEREIVPLRTTKGNRLFHSTLVLICLLLAVFNLRAQSGPAGLMNEAEAVRAALFKLVDGFNKRDAKAVLSSFTEDAYIVNPTRGVGDYKNLTESLTKAYAVPAKNTFAILIRVEEIQTAGDLAFVRLVWLRERNSDKAIISREKDLEIWRRERDGGWRLARGYSYYFKEDYPPATLVLAAPAKSKRDKIKRNGKPPNEAKDVAAVEAALERLAAAYNRRDLKGTMSLYAADALLSREGGADADREESRRAYSERFKNAPPFPARISYRIEELQISGEFAFARLSWLVERSSDRKILSRSRDLEIWRRQKNGNWKLVRGIGFYLPVE
ncbi:MAG TPA: DUF4440 domain-containing protein [Pyrinomonadaceae bacterium]|jgi:steroid delta-isomerase